MHNRSIVTPAQAALEAAGQTGSAEGGARQLALAVAAALGAVPAGAAAAQLLEAAQHCSDGRLAEATVAARLAATKVCCGTLLSVDSFA